MASTLWLAALSVVIGFGCATNVRRTDINTDGSPIEAGAVAGTDAASETIEDRPDIDVIDAIADADAAAIVDGPTEPPTEAASDTASSPRGTSGKAICPGDNRYAGMTPALAGTLTFATGETLANAEGPIWIASQSAFLFTAKMPGRDDIRRIGRIDFPGGQQRFIKLSTGSTSLGNLGMTLDEEDRLITADTQTSAVTRVDPVTGDTLSVVAATYMGRAFESPNDVIVRGDGNIYFTDPDNASVLGPRPKVGTTAVYRVSPAGAVSAIEVIGPATDQHLNDPNGVALSPDDNTLYFIITHRTEVRRFSLGPDGAPMGASASFATPTGPIPDGMCVDCAGNVYVATQAGVEVYSPGGHRMTALGPTGAINCSFGGSDHRTLLVTAAPRIWWGTMNIPGLP